MIWHALTVLWLLALLCLIGACRCAPTIVRVSGDSMEPTLHGGQYLATGYAAALLIPKAWAKLRAWLVVKLS